VQRRQSSTTQMDRLEFNCNRLQLSERFHAFLPELAALPADLLWYLPIPLLGTRELKVTPFHRPKGTRSGEGMSVACLQSTMSPCDAIQSTLTLVFTSCYRDPYYYYFLEDVFV
jgi:hypothetical protein